MDSYRSLPRLYTELAEWWPVLSTPEDYAEEAAYYQRLILETGSLEAHSMLELGSGGGNNASHLKDHFEMTLVDLSPGMLEVSQQLNPECVHHLGDMRSIRLGTRFDAVFIHDAIMYMQTEDDLARAIETAYLHCKPGGVALFAPDHTRETFRTSTSHGGHDRGARSLRYLEWTWDADPGDSIYVSDMVYLLREGDQPPRCIHDQHTLGLFSHQNWLDLIDGAGFQASSVPFVHSEIEPGTSADVYMGMRPSD